LEYQTATSEVLGVISRSQTSVQPVFGAILDCAVRLCGADLGAILRVNDGQLDQIEINPSTPEIWAVLRESYPRPVDATSLNGRAVMEARVIHVPDLEDPTAPASLHSVVKAFGFRCQLSVPMLRNGQAIALLSLQRMVPGPFSAAQIELVKTFADQAVIAIENAGLFEEVQARTKELQDSLDRQTATSEVLGVISRSPNEVQPVLDTIVATAQRLCQAERAIIWRLEGETFRAVAHHGHPEEQVESLYSARMPLSRGSMVGRATLARRAVQVEDMAADPELVAPSRALIRAAHTILAVPLLLKGHPIGGITLTRTRVAPFDDKQVALVEAFADQAVIAIENTRLFEAEQARTREVEVKSTELARSLEYQTAISDVLGVISRSPNELQPVFNTIVASSKRLLRAHSAGVTRVVGNELRLAAFTAINPETDRVLQNVYPMRLDGSGSIVAAIHKRTHFMIEDMEADDGYPRAAVEVARLRGYRSILFVPMLSKGEAIGTVNVTRPEPGSFSEEEIGLLKTFADQAVIAIENSRLFEEVQARTRDLEDSLEHATATSEVLKVISTSAFDLRPVLESLIENAVRLCSADKGL